GPSRSTQPADAPHSLRLPCVRREWPCCRATTEECDELAPPHGLPLRPSMISYFVVGIPRSASQENWPAMAATGAALRIRAKAAILVAKPSRAGGTGGCLWMDAPDFAVAQPGLRIQSSI